MHIMEGYLPLPHALGWSAVSFACLGWSLRQLRQKLQTEPETFMLIGAAAGYCFVLSSLKIPSVLGSSSHPTGIALGALLLGAMAMVPIGFLVLLFQAILLAHGGLTTLGANLFSLSILGASAAVLGQKSLKNLGLGVYWQGFGAALLSSLATYTGTALQLGFAFSGGPLRWFESSSQFLLVYAPTQIPLAVLEGLLTGAVLKYMVESKRVPGGVSL
jgi:cobalt/nickel transport system permease protein